MAKKITRISLALQGGGAHGAFTWGVLDRLLEEEGLLVDGISGTSAGAMNAVVLADGFERAGRDGAREALERFWRAMSERSGWSPFRSGWMNPFGADRSMWAGWFGVLTQFASPYQFNPFNINPLRDVLAETIDFDRLRACQQVKLFVSATNVHTNHMRVFRTHEIRLEVLMASGCLPHIHHAVEVDGEHYWDGGFLGNPVLEPLVTRCAAPDILIVQINPTRRPKVPTTAAEIIDRVNEITFNASLMREIRSIAALTRMVQSGELSAERYACTYFHMIAAEELLEDLGLFSKYDTDWEFLSSLRDLGRDRADAWLARNRDALGHRSTLDFSEWAPIPGEPAEPVEEPPPPVKRRGK